MDAPSIQQIITVWVDSYPKRRIPVDKNQRLIAFIELLKTLKENGYDRPGTSVCGEIIKESVPQNYKPVTKKNTWQEMAIRDLRSAIEIIFPQVELAKVTEADLVQKVKEKLEQSEPEEPDYVPMGKNQIKPDNAIKPNVEYDNDVLAELGFEK